VSDTPGAACRAAGADRTSRSADPAGAEARRRLVRPGARDPRHHLPRPAAAADLRGHRASPRCWTAARACSAACCRSAAAGGCDRHAARPRLPRLDLRLRRPDHRRPGRALRTVRDGAGEQAARLGQQLGIVQGGAQIDQLSGQLMGSLGRLGTAVSSALGAVTSLAMILVIGIFIAIEPRLYERGVAWMLPMRSRAASTAPLRTWASPCAG
jgi:hypothetical protein